VLLVFFVHYPPSPLESSLPSPFIDSRGGSRFTTNPRGCLGGEGGTGTVGVAVATWPGACRPSLGRHGDVMMGQWDILGAVEDVRFPVVDVWASFLC
jgi:hypothetical protein